MEERAEKALQESGASLLGGGLKKQAEGLGFRVGGSWGISK